MSERLRQVEKFAETLTGRQKNFLKNIYKFRVKKINWDLDQVLSDSEVPVKTYYDLLNGTKISEETFLDGWNPITEIIKRNGIGDHGETLRVEEILWTDPDVLFAAPPNYALRRFSLQASWRGIDQSITTSRTPSFSVATPEWVLKYFPWIDPKMVRQNNDFKKAGNEFKLGQVLSIMPDVHLEDSVKFMRLLRNVNSDIGIIGFPYVNDDLDGLSADNTIMFPDRKTFEDLSYILV